MFPPRVVENEPDSKDILTLARGFNALLETAKRLTRQEQQLRSRLQFAYDEYLKLADELADPDPRRTEVFSKILKDDEQDVDLSEEGAGDMEWIKAIEEAGYISSPRAGAIVDSMETTRRLEELYDRQVEYQKSNGCPLASGSNVKASVEKDFTTNGVKGNLRCPFTKSSAASAAGGQPNVTVNGDMEVCGNNTLDPIKAESQQAATTAGSASVTSAFARCPIRFLGDHSPEAVAEYFQKHKHEIPRSHSICIQRYQKDSRSVRQMDEKYGDLVNMVKGLGAYHQPYLPSTPDHAAVEKPQPNTTERVEKWAENVDDEPSPSKTDDPLVSVEVDDDDDDPDAREGRFDRSLRDIPVGESPSRPWGIHVPLSKQAPIADGGVASLGPPPTEPSTNWSAYYESPNDPSASIPTPHVDGDEKPSGAGRCPFDHKALQLGQENTTDYPSETPSGGHATPRNEPPRSNDAPTAVPLSSSKSQNPIVFHGPVFFGYSPESAALFLEKLGSAGKL